MSGLPEAEPKMLVISDSILNAGATAAHDVITEQKSSFSSEGMDARGCVNDREAKGQGTGTKSPLERLPNEIIITVFETPSSEDELAIAARVCLALTSKRFAQVAIQIAVQLPIRLTWEVPLARWCGSSYRDVPGFLAVVRPHHQLMVALRNWMPTRMCYCAYCGTWRTSCVAHDTGSPVLESGLYVSRLLTADGNSYICRTCHIKETTSLPKLGFEYACIMLVERLRLLQRDIEFSRSRTAGRRREARNVGKLLALTKGGLSSEGVD